MELDLHRFFYKNPNNLCVAGLDGFFKEVNDSFCEFLGYTKEDLLSKSFIELIHPDDVDKTLKEMESLSQGITTFSFENRYLKANGDYVNLLWNSDVDEAKGFIYAVATDITKMKAYEEELKSVNENLELRVQDRTKELKKNQINLEKALEEEKQFNTLKSKFISMASHEFRTPLTSVNSSADLIKLYVEKAKYDGILKHVDVIKGSVQHVHRLLEDFLSVTKLEEKRIVVYPKSFNIHELIEEVVSEIKLQLKEGQKIVVTSQDSNLEINSDRNILKNILFNLLTNASKYSVEHKTIEIQLSKPETSINIEIKDEGIGIPLDDQKFMFSRFFRASNTTGVKGTGLGLNIVKDYIEMLNSKISFESVEGQGSTFTLNLYDIK